MPSRDKVLQLPVPPYNVIGLVHMEFVMESKGRKGQCLYNKKWEHDSQYKAWVSAYKADKRKALCHWCDRTIDVSSMGESALKSHSRSEKHKQNSRCQQTGKLIFVTQANSLRKTAKEKFQELTDLNASLNSKLEKLKE